jgi:hypothetical protein
LGDEAEAIVGESVSLEQLGEFNYGVLPQHLSFTVPTSYASGAPLFYRQLLDLGQIPQIVFYPAAEYAAMSPLIPGNPSLSAEIALAGSGMAGAGHGQPLQPVTTSRKKTPPVSTGEATLLTYGGMLKR